MRFFVTGEQNRQSILNAIVLMFLGYVALLWMSNGMIYFHKMGLDPATVVEYYLGSEERFTQPKSYQSLLEVTHFHLFSMGLLVVTLAHLLLFTPLAPRLKIGLAIWTFLSAIADEAAGWLVRFVDPLFAWFKIAAFLNLELSLFTLLVFVGGALVVQRAMMRQQSAYSALNKERGIGSFGNGA